MAWPKKALRYSQLIFESAGAAVKDGSHQTFRVKTGIDGVEREGFFKKLAPDYPELLAKMSVAASIFKRSFQGKRSAEERLVFDDNGKLVGTLSINLDGYKPLNFASEGIPTDPVLKERVVPSTKTLIEHDMMEILIGRWFLHDDDSHPHNLSLAGDIDYDMFWYWFTIEMKGARPFIGVPNSMINLTVKDWARFPALIESTKPFYWPTFKNPGQITAPGAIPTAALSYVCKDFADPSQFENLARSSAAQEQKLAAALKILITYQPEVMRKRLEEQFGDMSLNFACDENLRKKYEEKFPKLCNDKTNKGSFVDFIMNIYQEHYDNLYRVVVFYKGCTNNEFGLALPSTSDALYHTPSIFKNILTWVQKENEANCKNNPEVQLNLVALKSRYHQIWRDAYTPNFRELLHDSYKLTTAVLNQVSNTPVSNDLVLKEVTDAQVTRSWELFGNVPELSQEKIKPLISVDKDSQLREALSLLIEFTNKFNVITKGYYDKERVDLTEDDNNVFSEQLSDLVKKYNYIILEKLNHTTSNADEFTKILTSLKKVADQVSFKVHLLRTDAQMKSIALTTTVKEILPLHHEEVIKQYNNNLFSWAKSLSTDRFNQYITDIVNKYEPLIPVVSDRKRGKPVKDYLQSSASESNDVRLAYILSSGRSEQGALNTLLIEHLTQPMLQTQNVPSVSNAVDNHSFNTSVNLSLYTKAAVAYASQCKQFVHLYSEEGTRLFFQTMFTWVAALDKNAFLEMMATGMTEYNSRLSLTTRYGLWSTSRNEEIKPFFKHPNQAKIVAKIFLQGKETSTLNDALFHTIINAMKKDINSDSNKQTMLGYKLIQQYNSEEHKDAYLQLLRTHSAGPSHILDTMPVPVRAVVGAK